MKSTPTPLIVMIALVLFLTMPVMTPDVDSSISPLHRELTDMGGFLPSEAGGSGSDLTATAIMSRAFSGRNLSILNTYASPTKHNGTIDLSDYQIPGWTLYNVTIDIESLVATCERAVVGVSSDVLVFDIREYDSFEEWRYTALAQGFYNKSHDGALLNYSFYYDSPTYTPVTHGWAVYSVLSDYETASSNLTSYTNLPTRAAIGVGWENVIVGSVVLSAETQYYVVINGSALTKEEGVYPHIRWRAESGAGDFTSRQYTTASGTWLSRSVEALLNYTYIPWNQTSNSPRMFNTTEISLRANQTPIDGDRVSFETPGSNITLLQFDSDQSVYMAHNMTLWYSKSVTTTTSWDAPEPGQDILWNQTLILEYPLVPSGEIEQMAVLSKMSDWTVTGLYNGTETESYEHYTARLTFVDCSDMTNGTWTMTFTAPNYVNAIEMSDSGISITDSISIEAILFINNTVQDSVGNPATGGDTNLSVYYQSDTVHTALNDSLIDGEVSFQWDISESTSDNGLYVLDIFWSNGTEAGYLSTELVVFYPTSLTPIESLIYGFTDDIVRVTVDFEDTFNENGLNDTVCDIVYSFDGDPYVSMTDPSGNGTWYADIDTTGKDFGSYIVQINASGFALENETIQVTLELVHDTNPLQIEWTNTETITYLEQTTLKVNYTRVDGSPVVGAMVNITIGSDSWTAEWNGVSETYDITFNGTDSPPGLGIHTVSINASLTGYVSRNTTEILTINEEPTSPLGISWHTSNNITYIEQTTLRVQYTLPDTTSITSATVTATIDTDVFTLSWNATSGYYEYVFFGDVDPPGFGTNMVVTVNATLHGYESQESGTTLTVRYEPATIDESWTTFTITWMDNVNFTAEYLDSNNDFIPGADAVIYINGSYYDMLEGAGVYYITLNNTFDLGYYTVVVEISKYGYTSESVSGIDFSIVEEPTSISVAWEPANVTIEYTSSLNLTVHYLHDATPVPEPALVNVTIAETAYVLDWTGTHWYVSIPGNSIGLGEFTAYISAWAYGYQHADNLTTGINITKAPNTFFAEWTPSDLNATYIDLVCIKVTYTYEFEPILGATVQLILNSTRTYDLQYNESDGEWYINLLASEIDLGVYNATVRANKTGYYTGRSEETLYVVIAQSDVTSNWEEETIYYTRETNLDIEFLDIVGNPIIDAIVNATYDGTTYTLQHQGSGIYRLLFNGSHGLGVYSIDVETFRYGFDNKTLSLILSIVETPIIHSITSSYTAYNGSASSVLYYDGILDIEVEIADIDLTPIEIMTTNITIDGVLYPLISMGGGVYAITLNASEVGVGSFIGQILADLYGYESLDDFEQLDVLPIPTLITLDSEVLEIMHINQTITVTVDFINAHNELNIDVDSISCIWPIDVPSARLSTGKYQLEISSYLVAIGYYQLNVTFHTPNYSSSSLIATIYVRAIQTSLTSLAQFQDWENETILIYTTYMNLDHNVGIHWANATATINGVEHSLEYLGEGRYGIQYFIDLSPVTYSIQFSAEATDCEAKTATSQLIVNQKRTVYFEFQLPVSASEGSSITIGATLREQGTDIPISGAVVIFSVSSTFENGTLVEDTLNALTNTQGFASQAFNIPMGIVNLTVTAIYEGSQQIWRVALSSETIQITPGFVAQVITTLTTPPFNYVVVAFLALAVVAAVYNKAHKPKIYARRRSLENQLRAFRDLETLRHFMAVYLERGTCVFYYPFTDARIQPDLISGFIAAITNVYGEIKGDGVRGTLEEIHYQGLRLNSYSGKFIIGILILEGDMSPLLRERLQFFVEMFENQYESHLTEWEGIMDCFDPEWVISNLNDTFNYSWMLPHRVSNKKLGGDEKKAVSYIKSNLENHEFRFADMLESLSKHMGATEAETLDLLIQMEENGILVPISTHTVIQRQGMGIVGEDEEEIIFQPIEDLKGEGMSEDVQPTLEDENEEELAEEEDVATTEDSQDSGEPLQEEDEAESFIKEVESLMSKEKEGKENNDS